MHHTMAMNTNRVHIDRIFCDPWFVSWKINEKKISDSDIVTMIQFGSSVKSKYLWKRLLIWLHLRKPKDIDILVVTRHNLTGESLIPTPNWGLCSFTPSRYLMSTHIGNLHFINRSVDQLINGLISKKDSVCCTAIKYGKVLE